MVVIHFLIIDRHFSEYYIDSPAQRGIRDSSLFLSALMEPRQTFGKTDLYPDVLTKAAAYLRSFALDHAFFDGNKRTALLAMVIFLENNGYEVIADNKKLIRFVKTVVLTKPTVKQIREKYLKKYCRWVGPRKLRLMRLGR